MRWKGGERDSKEVRGIEIDRVERNMQRLSEEGIERYMESYVEMERLKREVYRDDENENEKSDRWWKLQRWGKEMREM